MLHTSLGASSIAAGVMERREFGRRDVALPGTIKLPLRPALTCMMLNVSRGGALLEVSKFEFVPAKFWLVVGNFESECHVRHRNGRHIGVEFAVPCRYDPVEHD